MPNTREKLIELLKDANAELQKQPGARVWGDLADILIANGVTVQKWIPVTERLPDAWVDVLSCDRNKNLTVDCVDEKGKWYSEYKDLEEVTHWMPLPEPPKGE